MVSIDGFVFTNEITMNKTMPSNLKTICISLLLSFCMLGNVCAQSDQEELIEQESNQDSTTQLIEENEVEATPLPLDEIQTFAEIFTEI